MRPRKGFRKSVAEMDAGTVIILGYAGIISLTNVIVLMVRSYPRISSALGSTTNDKLVSIVVPVRNEEDSVQKCVESLIGLNYARKEIIFVDGGSTDNTSRILSRYPIQTIREPKLPSGWIGKNWACQNGYIQSSGDLILFTDGDTYHAPESLATTVGLLNHLNLDMLTLLPRVVTEGFWEKALLPIAFQAIFFFTGGNRVNNPKSHRHLANGQYLLIRREAYEKIGRHEAVRDRIDEDYRIAQKVKDSGLTSLIALGPEILQTRMYKNFHEIWEGWTKNVFAGSNYRIGWFLLGVFMVFALLLTPYLIFFYGILDFVSLHNYVPLMAGAIMLLVMTFRVGVMNRKWQFDARYSLIYALSVCVFIGIMLNSMIGYTTGRGVTWKGRTYRYLSGSLAHD